MQFLRWLLLPLSLLYGFVVIIRNWLYDAGIFKSREFDLPVISVGNLEVGGAGKSPMTEYLIALFKRDYKLATLSRGYGRQTKGFITAPANAVATQVGDEPAQFKSKYPDVTVAVCEDRAAGIDNLKAQHNLIILDDAFQHRAVKPGFSILLFDYKSLQQPQFMLPAGNLREPFSGRWRADMMVVTKCPPNIGEAEFTRCYNRLSPMNWQPLFFSSIKYQPLRPLNGNDVDISIDADTTVFLLTGIANPAPLTTYLQTQTPKIVHHNYPDHHQFTLKNISKLAADFAACTSPNKLIITTEKDAQRLREQSLQNAVAQLPFFVQPIGIEFLNNGQQNFDKIITDYVRQYPNNN
ncbi:tetraacyldisaccharide 4'-kinase [Mucilaginibacter pallidiroseus]|uniref:Tetraacyldisaccharide 4'-kinase n=1 Tax=Mucilaginibacter pallidiroseus TaxID=2599295 RepID=A0A563U7Z8_9SPHI|nr:tetraacyldisaccharide 4'-kinase [Mucilaginibacter pallidiroseus]TWR27419.1 tetraacyldisaccharide 4'-kinase [Mucilaginibacter pallidiroseus]